MWNYEGDGYGHMNGGGWFLMSLGMFLLVVIAIAVTVMALRAAGVASGSHPASPQLPTPDRAAALLRERLARGEIDADDYERLRRALEA